MSDIVIEECHLAVVVANQDPEQLGRVRVKCQALLDGEDEDLPQWIRPLPQWGWFVVPDVGETIEVVAITGASDDEQPGTASIANINLRWRGVRQWGNTKTDTPRAIPEEFKTNYGKRRGFATPSGHIFWFDDTEGSEAIQLRWANNKGKKSTMHMDENGNIVLTNSNDSAITLDAQNKLILIMDENGNEIKMENGLITIKATKVKLDATNIELGGNVHTGVFGDILQTWLAAHTHSGVQTGPGASGPPVAPPSGIQSAVVKLG